MRMVPQIIVTALIVSVAIPLAARFVPGTHPWLEGVGLLEPLTTLGIVPAGAAVDATRQAQGNAGARGVLVSASEVVRHVLQDEILSIGSAKGVQSVEASFEVTGRLTALAVAAGDRVATGDVMAELDAEAAQLSVDRARLVLENARKTVVRLEQLAQSGAATTLQRQDAELVLRTAELEQQSAERDLADHRLLAPVSGYVGLIAPQVGDLVTPSTPITRIEDRSRLIIEFRVPERVASLVAVGGPVQATAISWPGQAIEGRIVAVDNRVEETSRTLLVQASIDNADDRLRAGMAIQITMIFTGAEVPAVDPMAVQWGTDGAFVWVVRNTKAARLPIRILQRSDQAVLIDAAFQPGDLVVTEGVQTLRPGADVSLIKPES